MTEPETPGNRPTQDGQLMAEAARWFARMRGDEAEAIRTDFEAWLARGALHRAAYNRASEIFSMGKLLGEAPLSPGPRLRDRPGLLTAAAAFLCLVIVAAAWMALRPTAPAAHGPVVAANGLGETMTRLSGETPHERLADGSSVRLASGTRLDLRFDARERRLHLIAGSARFEVQHDARPFIVHAAGGLVVARGTIFEVTLSPAREVEVRLLEGAVDVYPPAGDGVPATRRLQPGETYSFSGVREGIPAGTSVTMRQPEAPRQHMEEFDAVPLGDLVVRANRAGAPSIRLADAELASRRISGRISLGDNARLAERLAALLDVDLHTNGAGEIVLQQRAQ